MYKEEQILEFDKIKNIWAEYALTEAAKQKIEEAKPYLEEVITIAQKGECLSVAQLILVQNALTAVERLKSYLCRGKFQQISLCFYEENLDALSDLREMIYLQIVTERRMELKEARHPLMDKKIGIVCKPENDKGVLQV